MPRSAYGIRRSLGGSPKRRGDRHRFSERSRALSHEPSGQLYLSKLVLGVLLLRKDGLAREGALLIIRQYFRQVLFCSGTEG